MNVDYYDLVEDNDIEALRQRLADTRQADGPAPVGPIAVIERALDFMSTQAERIADLEYKVARLTAHVFGEAT